MDIEQIITNHLSRFDDYDIRRTRNARYFDQKVTPDVLMVVADSILNFIGNDIHKEFTRSEIQRSPYCNKYVKAMFNKPDTGNLRAGNEYDKFFGQPLRAMYHSHILSCSLRGNSYVYRVDHYEILEYISTKDFFAFNFLSLYFEKVLTDSGFIRHINTYKQLWDNNRLGNQSFEDLKGRWDVFLLNNTSINGKKESHRIWPKVFNVLAVKYHMPGTIKGHMSESPFYFNDLLYNRINWRDTGKDKRLTRAEVLSDTRKLEFAEEYRIRKAIQKIQQLYSTSELSDKYAAGDATCVHHIFPKNEYPEIAAYFENLIKLTVRQHLEKAHPKHNTSQIDRSYQLDCLLAKSNSIEKSINNDEFIYSIDDFVTVINKGLKTDWPKNYNLKKIRAKLIEHWSRSA